MPTGVGLGLCDFTSMVKISNPAPTFGSETSSFAPMPQCSGLGVEAQDGWDASAATKRIRRAAFGSFLLLRSVTPPARFCLHHAQRINLCDAYVAVRCGIRVGVQCGVKLLPLRVAHFVRACVHVVLSTARKIFRKIIFPVTLP